MKLENRTLVLRKSVGPFSAGTPVKSTDTYDPNDCRLLRSRSDIIPANNRAKRRQSKIAEYEIMKELFNG